MSSQRAVKRKGEGNRLSDRQRLEIIALLEQPKSPSMRNIARQYGVDEKTIRKLKANKNIICERAQRVDQATQESTFRVMGLWGYGVLWLKKLKKQWKKPSLLMWTPKIRTVRIILTA